MILSDIRQYQRKAWTILSRSYQNRRIAGTYLFYGRPGLGDWHLAISLAGLLNCEAPVKADDGDGLPVPCDRCRTCRQIASLNFEGLLFALPITSHNKLDEATDLTAAVLEEKRLEPFKILSAAASRSIPIAVARDVKRRLSQKASAGVTRVVIFYQMERMLPASADALLKLIEEPPGDTVVILTAINPEVLLPTVQSRAQKIRLDRMPEEAIVKYLEENYGTAEDRAVLLARISEGSLGSAIEMLAVDADDDSSRRAVGLLLFRSLFADRPPDTVAHMIDLLKAKDVGEAEELLRLWQSLLRDCAKYALTGDDSGMVNIDFAPELKRLSKGLWGPPATQLIVENIKNTLADLRRNVHIQGALVALALKIKSHLKGVH
ncbi:MAG: hypothetical protein OEW00_10925 [candidate division Zixibacteria bacterium]|nr:hypothetical protein [candidate division Zixibacteria bacterium]